MYRKFNLKSRAPQIASMLLCLGLLATAAKQLQAQDSWLLQISEKENQLANPTDPMWMKANMWDVSYQRMFERNMPVIELTNMQPSFGPDITELQLTIGDTRFHFEDDYLGTFALLGNTTPGYQLTSTANGGNLLTVNILDTNGGGGLAPGETVRFKIDIDVDETFEDEFFAHPDFRTVLFDMNGIEVYGDDPNIAPGAEDNAQATIMFSNGTSSGPVAFVDEVVTDPSANYFNNFFRPYGIMEPVKIFDIGGGMVIPEPGTAVLGLAGLFGGLLLRRSR